MRSKLVCLVGLLHLVCVCAAASAGCPPPAADIPVRVEIPSQVSAVALSDLEIAAWDGLDAQFLLANRTDQGIAYLTVVLEFRTKKGDLGEPVVFEAAPDTSQPSNYLIPAEQVHLLPHPILPGRQEWMSGRSPYTPPGCPVSALVTMVDIHFDDGSGLKWEAREWWTEPLLADYPTTYFSIPDSTSWTADEYFFKVTLDGEGKVVAVGPLPGSPPTPTFTVADALAKLRFSPSLARGRPTPTALTLVIKFNRAKALTSERKLAVHEPTIMEPVVFVSLGQHGDSKTKWDFYFGGGFGYKTNVARRAY
jgi:hypothetical protein